MADRSLVNAAQAVRTLTMLLAPALDRRTQLQQVLRQLAYVLSAPSAVLPPNERPPGRTQYRRVMTAWAKLTEAGTGHIIKLVQPVTYRL
jgi:hypothetical protein